MGDDRTAAKSSGDDRYGSLAKHLAMSLRAAGVSIRDASDRYHVQLKAALLSGQRPGLRFTNIPLLDDLHSAFHFLLAELSSARDYLAAIAALGVGAPENVDALSRLVKWLSNSKSGSALADPLIAAFLDNEAQVWLGEITDYRNQFLHRKPLGADESARWLRLRQHDSPMGSVTKLEMKLSPKPESSEEYEALERFVELYRKMLRFAGFAASISPYPAEPMAISIKDLL